jgi:hypothetical protein
MTENAFTDSGTSPPEPVVDAAREAVSLSPTEERVESATESARSTGQVSPEVAGFIERVVVPALVKRYISQLSSTRDMEGLPG